MPDAITSSPPPASPAIDKMANNRREITDSGDDGQKDFAATFDAVKDKQAPEAANDEQAAANPDPQAASAVLDRAAMLPPPDVLAVPVAGGEAPTVAPVDVTADPAAAAAAATAAAPAVVAATTAPASLGKLGGPQLRPESRVAAQWTAPAGLDATARKPGIEPAQASTQSQVPVAGAAGVGEQEFKLPDAMLVAKAGDSGLESGDGTRPATTGTATAAAEQAVSAASTRETDARNEIVKLDTRLPLHSTRFSETFSQQVIVLSQHGVQQAQMTLNPPELGPIDVRITVDNDQASVQIAAASGVARDVIQDALPKLREMLDQSGVRLNDAGVFAQLPQREQSSPQSQAQRQDWLFNGPGPRRGQEDDAGFVPRVARRVGLIDAYA